VARLLRLDYYKLKGRAAVLTSAPRGNSAPPGFVEVNVSPMSSTMSGWTLELSDAQGRKLTLRGPSEPACWGEVARAFWPEGAA
jgi:hypothetical protein